MDLDSMETAVRAQGLAWMITGCTVVDESDPRAVPSVRNTRALSTWVHIAQVKAVSEATLAQALRDMADGDRSGWDAILAL